MLIGISKFFTLEPSFISGPSSPDDFYFTGDTITMEGCSFNTTFTKGFFVTTFTPQGGRVAELEDDVFTWTGDVFEVQLDKLEYGNITTNMSGLYFCRINVSSINPFQVESDSQRIHVEGKGCGNFLVFSKCYI